MQLWVRAAPKTAVVNVAGSVLSCCMRSQGWHRENGRCCRAVLKLVGSSHYGQCAVQGRSGMRCFEDGPVST